MPLTLIYTDSQGREWRYKRGTSRIRCYLGPDGEKAIDEVNIWDHARGKPDFDCDEQTGLRDRVLRHLREAEEEAEASHEAVPPPRAVRRADGLGCVERVHPSELAWEERYG